MKNNNGKVELETVAFLISYDKNKFLTTKVRNLESRFFFLSVYLLLLLIVSELILLSPLMYTAPL